MFNGDLDQCFVGLVAPVSFVALAHSAADAGLALLHHWFRATALSNHLHESLHKEGGLGIGHCLKRLFLVPAAPHPLFFLPTSSDHSP